MRDSQRQTDYAAQAARVLAAAQPSTVPPPLGDRGEAISAIERALRARGHRRWHWRWGGPALATLAAAAAVLLVVRSQPERQRAGTAARVPASPAAAAELTAGTALHGPSAIVLATGTRLTLDARATAQVLEGGATQRMLLTAGGLSAEVAKQALGHRFIVQTPDAEVEVKGTRFDVTVSPLAAECAPATQTRVIVHEGVVAVRFGGGEQLLHPGANRPS